MFFFSHICPTFTVFFERREIMGQDPSTQRLANEAECFRRKVLLVRPPPRLLARLQHQQASGSGISSGAPSNGLTGGSAHSTFIVRILRSIAVNVVVWNGSPLLPEQWHHVFGNQHAVVYFFSENDLRQEGGGAETFTHTIAKVEEASVDPFMCSSFVVHDADGEQSSPSPNKSARRLRQATAQNDVVDPAGGAAADDSSEGENEPTEEPSDRLRAISHAAGVRFFPLEREEDEHALQCLVAAQFCPSEISRPLCSLLYQLVESCSATEAHLVDSVTLLPIQTTVDVDVSLSAPLNRLCWALKTCVARFARGGRSVESVSCVLSSGGRSIFVGWASKPLLYVVVVVDDKPGQCVGPALVEKNIEYFSMHFYNVVSNTTTKRQYAPMM